MRLEGGDGDGDSPSVCGVIIVIIVTDSLCVWRPLPSPLLPSPVPSIT